MLSLHWAGSYESVERSILRASLLEDVQLAPGVSSTQLRAGRGSYWLACPDIGAIRFSLAFGTISVYPKESLGDRRFEQALAQEWLPLVYQAWGFQVLHASAAVHLASRRVVAFSGLAGAGKSTLGYGLGQRPGWQQIADESLALAVEQGRIHLTPIANFTRLRPASALHYDVRPADPKMLDWPQLEMGLERVIFLQAAQLEAKDHPHPVQIFPLDGAEAYPLFLQQAFAITLKMHDHNQRLMQDYLQVARIVPAYRLIFPKSFSVINEILDGVEDLVLSSGQTSS